MSTDLRQTHFELFGLQPGYDVDREALSAIHLDLQKAVHPDRYAAGSPHEKLLAVQRAAQVNEAYGVLRDPLERARYLLHLNGIDTAEETNTAMDPAFLMEQMEWREQLDEVADAGDAPGALLAIVNQLEQARRGLHRELAGLFEDGSGEAMQQAADIVRKLRFMDKLLQQTTEMEEQFF